MDAKEIVKALREHAEWAQANEWECPITLGDDLRKAAEHIEQQAAELDGYNGTGLTAGDVKDLQALCETNGLAKYVDLIVRAKRQMGIDNERSIEQAERIEQLEAENARLRAERDKAVADMKVMAIAMRESEELSEGCCFACIYDAQNLPDNVMLAYGECPGYDRDDCFDWRGTEGKA